jgi:hypothetical protein
MLNQLAHIGIIAGTADGAALCYRTLCHEAERVLGRHAYPEITMHALPLEAYLASIDAGDWAGVAALMSRSASVLAHAGAELIISPITPCIARLISLSPRCRGCTLPTPSRLKRDGATIGGSASSGLGRSWKALSTGRGSRKGKSGSRCRRFPNAWNSTRSFERNSSEESIRFALVSESKRSLLGWRPAALRPSSLAARSCRCW